MPPKKSIYLALVAIVLWSTAGTAFKLALRQLSFAQLLFISSHVAWLTLLCIFLLSKRKATIGLKELSKSALGGFLNPFLYYLILLKAYSLLPAQIAQPLNYTWPIMLAILSVPFLKQKLRWFDFAAILIGFCGVLTISLQGTFAWPSSSDTLLGIGLASGSSIIWASFWIYNLKDKRDELEKLLFNFFFGALFISIWIAAFDVFPRIDRNWVPAIYVGLTEMAIAFVCWLVALKYSKNNSRLGNLVFFSPFLALFFIHLVLDEAIHLTTLFGLVLIVGGVLFQQFMLSHGKRSK